MLLPGVEEIFLALAALDMAERGALGGRDELLNSAGGRHSETEQRDGADGAAAQCPVRHTRPRRDEETKGFFLR